MITLYQTTKQLLAIFLSLFMKIDISEITNGFVISKRTRTSYIAREYIASRRLSNTRRTLNIQMSTLNSGSTSHTNTSTIVFNTRGLKDSVSKAIDTILFTSLIAGILGNGIGIGGTITTIIYFKA